MSGAAIVTALIFFLLTAVLLTYLQRARVSLRHRQLQGAYGGKHRPHPPFGQAFAGNLLKLIVIGGAAIATALFLRSK